MTTRTMLAAAALLLPIGLAACAPQPAAPTSQPKADHKAATAKPAAPATAPSVADLVGSRGSSGESELQARGYTSARTRGLTAYWWHPAGACVRVVTDQGRYKTVDTVPASNCGR